MNLCNHTYAFSNSDLSISVHKVNQYTYSVKCTCIRQLLSRHNVHFQAKALSIQLRSQQQQGEATAVVHWQLQTAVSFCVQRSETSFSGCWKWMWATGNTYLSMSHNWNNLRVSQLHLTNDMALSPLWLPYMYSDFQNSPSCMQKFFGHHALGQGQIYIRLVKKVKCSHYRPGVAQRVGRGTALLFHDHGTREGWVVSSMLRPHFTPGKDPVPILQEAEWAPRPVWMGGKSRPHRDSIPGRPAHSQSLYWLSYPAHISDSAVWFNFCEPESFVI